MLYYCNGKKGVCDGDMLCNTCEHCDNTGGRYITENPYWERICKLSEKQRAKGMETYRQGLEDNPAALVERIDHLEEELIDGLMYCEWIKDKLFELERERHD